MEITRYLETKWKVACGKHIQEEEICLNICIAEKRKNTHTHTLCSDSPCIICIDHRSQTDSNSLYCNINNISQYQFHRHSIFILHWIRIVSVLKRKHVKHNPICLFIFVRLFVSINITKHLSFCSRCVNIRYCCHSLLVFNLL